MRRRFNLLVAAVLTLPIYVILANTPIVDAWFSSGDGWTAFEPVFRTLESLGVQGEGRIVIAVMLAVSFLIALVLVLGVRYILGQTRTRKA